MSENMTLRSLVIAAALVASSVAMADDIPVTSNLLPWSGTICAGTCPYVPSCDQGVEWLREHNFSTCHRTTVTDESCQVLPESADTSGLVCTTIPRPL